MLTNFLMLELALKVRRSFACLQTKVTISNDVYSPVVNIFFLSKESGDPIILIGFYVLLKLTARKSLQKINCLFYNTSFNFS